MQIQIDHYTDQAYANLGRYVHVTMTAGKHHATVVIAPQYVQVCVHNASNRTWRGLGRQFRSLEEAVSHYKAPAVQQMVRTAQQLASQMSSGARPDSRLLSVA